MLVLQGLDDKIVPPAQAEAIVAALAANRIPHAYLAFAGEGHGFRGADAIRRSLEAELSFLAAVFGYTRADETEPLEVIGLEAWRARRASTAAAATDPPPPTRLPPPPAPPPPPDPEPTMDAKAAIELVLLLLIVATALAYLARRLGIPYPILLVLGGVVLGLVLAAIPDAPTVQLPPDIVFLLFLPPILFGSGYFTQIRDFKANARPIALLAIGLVLFTTVVVGLVVGLLVPSLQWAPAFALGAIVAPPDAVAATSVLRRLGVPRRVVTILEGESLVNDASALIAYRVAVAAVVTGSFALLDASVSFVVRRRRRRRSWASSSATSSPTAWRRTGDATLEIVLSLIAPDLGVPHRRGARGERGPRDGRRRAHRRAHAPRACCRPTAGSSAAASGRSSSSSSTASCSCSSACSCRSSSTTSRPRTRRGSSGSRWPCASR